MSAVLLLAVAALPALGADKASLRDGARRYAAGEYEKALEAYSRAAEADPKDAEARFGLGAALYELGKHDLAEAAFRQAAEMTGDPDARYNLGNVEFRRDRFQEAAESYREVLRRDPAAADAKHNLAVTLLRKQDRRPQEAPPKEGPPKDSSQGPPPKSPPKPRQGMSKDDAQRLLQAIKEREKEQSPKALERQKAEGKREEKGGQEEKDW